MSDAEAIQAVRNGDKDRYAELVHRYQRMVYAIAWSRLGDRDLCEDAAQETFVKAYHYLMALRNPAKFPGWLARIAQNVSTSILRRRKRELDKRERWRLEQPETTSAIDTADDAPITETLRETLAELPAQHRECLALYYLEGKSVRDAAELLSISESTMKTRLHRARQALRGRLEEKLEDSLAALGPRKNFSAGVIVLLPSSPWLAGAGVGGASIGSKLLTGLAQFALLPMVLFMSLFNVAFAALFFGWLGKLESANLAPGPGQRARQQVIRRYVLLLVIAGAMAIIFSFSFAFRGNPLMVFQLLVPFCAWGTYRTLRFLRVNRTPFAYGQLLANATFTLTSILIGFLHAPFWIFFVAMLPLNVVLYYANKSRPARHDYNLFLRAAQGMLGKSEAQGGGIPRVTDRELRAFARFLGNRFLVLDYTIRVKSLCLYLPPVKPTLRQFFGINESNSTVQLSPDGGADAELGARDRKNLATMVDSPLGEVAELEATVSEAISEAFRLFLDGQTEQAEVLLQPENDTAIFRKPVGDSAEHRARGILAIVAAVFLLAFSLVTAFWKLPPPIRVTGDEINEAMVAWKNDYDLRWVAFHSVLSADAPLSLDALAAPARTAYRNAAIQLLTEGRDDADGRATNALFGAEALYNIIQSNLLSDAELASLGIDSKTVRQALTGTNQVRLDHLFILWNEAEGAYVYPGSVVTIARRLACLKHFGCLDLVDSDRLAHQLADRQVTPAWESRDESLDWKRAQGLFMFKFCDLEGTYGTLAALEELDRLDLIDREACVEAILRFHNGTGQFGSGRERDRANIRIYPSTKANALDRIPDFTRWNLKPEIIVTDRNQPIADNVSTPDAIVTWACQKRIELVRATYQLPERDNDLRQLNRRD
ncbi:MAG: hypothetical protein AMXMBFR82_38060 [Candidatus Hydrogenedentota bacterium]